MSEQQSQANVCPQCGQDLKGAWVCGQCGYVGTAYFVGGAVLALVGIAVALVATIALLPTQSGGRIVALAGADLVCGGTGLIVFVVVLSEIKKGIQLLRQLGDRASNQAMRKAIGWVIGLSVVVVVASAAVGFQAKGSIERSLSTPPPIQPDRISVLPSSTKTVVPTVAPTASPLPFAANFAEPGIILGGWQEIEITHLCLEYSLKGVSPIPKSLNMETILLSGLEAYGIQVITDTNDGCDGVLTIDATVRPLSAPYTPGGKCYSGASVDIKMTLAAQGHQASFQIRNEQSPPTTITSCAKNPEDAPFASLWRCEFIGVLGQIWGPPFYLANLRSHGLSSDAMKRIKCTAPTDETIDLVLSKLGDPIGDSANYRTALELVSYWVLTEAAPYLHASIHTPDLPYYDIIATAHALSALGELGEKDLPPIIAVVKASKSVLVASDVTAVFRGVTPPEAAIPPLLAALEGANYYVTVRATIAASLAELGEPAYEYVIPMLENSSKEVRDEIVNRLRYQDHTVIAPLLSFAAQTESLPAQQAITKILAQVSGHEFGEDLDAWQRWWQEMEDQMSSLQPDDFATALASDEVILRQYTLEQIVELGPPAADTLPILTGMLNSEKGRNQRLTALALGGLGPEGVDAISNQISDNTTSYSIYVDFSIYAALGIIGPNAIDSVPVLITNLSKVDICEVGGVDVGPVIIRALNNITGQNFGCDVDAWQTWWDESH